MTTARNANFAASAASMAAAANFGVVITVGDGGTTF